MNRSTFALFVALLIHLVLLLLFWMLGSLEPQIKKQAPKENKIRVSLKELPKKIKKVGTAKKKIIKKPKIAPPMPKGKQLKKIVKKQKVKFQPKQKKLIPTLNKPQQDKPVQKPKPKPKVKQVEQKPFIPLLNDINITSKPKPKPKKRENSLYSMLSQDKSSQEKKEMKRTIQNGSSIRSDVKELYGEEFGKLSPGQQKYILDNQEIMRRITQQVLTRVARVNLPIDLNVNRSNVIEFYLHPNGDMTDFKFLEKSGYYILDDTTKETIEYAYSRYPRPTEKTLIRYNVFYNLARY